MQEEMTTDLRKDPADKALIGMLCWEDGAPVGFEQFVELPGHFQNATTYDFPIRCKQVPGANFDSTILDPSDEVLQAMKEAARNLEKEGVRALTTSCGFNAILHSKLANSVNIPVFSSSLIQVPLVYKMLTDNQKVAIITARESSLTNRHLAGVGIDPSVPLLIKGLKGNSKEWEKMEKTPEREIDLDQFRDDIVKLAKKMVKNNPEVGAFVLEGTDFTAFSEYIRKTTNLPVFDLVTLIHMVYNTLSN